MIPQLIEDFIQKTAKIIAQDERFCALLAMGSYTTRQMDEYSDIDLVIVVKDKDYEAVMAQRKAIADGLGELLVSFTGEHVGEPRLLICLYANPLMHVDLKFVALSDAHHRVEKPVIIWQRADCATQFLKLAPSQFPTPSLQWIEDRFWVWVHYGATKIGRGELFEAIEFISFLRQSVVGNLLLMQNGHFPRGVRRIEQDAALQLEQLKRTIPTHSAESCIAATEQLIELYLSARDALRTDGLELHTKAQERAIEYLLDIKKVGC